MSQTADDSPETPALEEFEAPGESMDQSEDSTLNLDPGESHIGTITGVDFSAGDGAGLVEIDGKTLWLNWTLRAQLIEALLYGQPIAYVKLDEEEEFTDEDGETRTYNPREFRFLEGDA